MSKKRGPGQPPKLTPELHKRIVKAIEQSGAPYSAALVHGVAISTFNEWLQRGNGTHERPSTPEYAEFAVAVARARAVASERLVKRIEEIGEGGTVIRRRTITDKNGNVVVEEDLQPPDWRAHGWKAERVDREQWGRASKVDVTATLNVKVAQAVVAVVQTLLAEYVPAASLEAATDKAAQLLDKALGTGLVAIPGGVPTVATTATTPIPSGT